MSRAVAKARWTAPLGRGIVLGMMPRRRFLSRCGAIAAWALCGAAYFSAGLFVRSGDLHDEPAAGELRLTALAVGAGSCNIVELPDGRTMVIDAGSSTLADPVGRCIEPFLRRRGITRIDTLILSHANYDHFSAAADLLPRYRARQTCLAPQFLADSAGNAAAARLLRTLDAHGPPPRLLVAGDRLQLGPVTRLDVLWPHQDADVTANESSLVLRLSHAGRSILFTGDIESTAQGHLLEDGVDLRADVLIAPHHGSFEPTTAAFLRAVDPRAVISSNGRSLSRRQRDFDDIVAVPHFRTHPSGAITVTISGAGALSVTPFHGR